MDENRKKKEAVEEEGEEEQERARNEFDVSECDANGSRLTAALDGTLIRFLRTT